MILLRTASAGAIAAVIPAHLALAIRDANAVAICTADLLAGTLAADPAATVRAAIEAVTRRLTKVRDAPVGFAVVAVGADTTAPTAPVVSAGLIRTVGDADAGALNGAEQGAFATAAGTAATVRAAVLAGTRRLTRVRFTVYSVEVESLGTADVGREAGDVQNDRNRTVENVLVLTRRGRAAGGANKQDE